MTRPSPPAVATVSVRPPATADAQRAEDYRRGREEGATWARDFATVDELRGFVASFGDTGNEYWRGFLAAAQEELDAVNGGKTGRAG
jgi:hypothetical protein